MHLEVGEIARRTRLKFLIMKNIIFESNPFWFNRLMFKWREWDERHYNNFKQK